MNQRTLYINVQGEGIQAVTVTPETTVADIVNQNGWNRFGITVDDTLVAPSNWGTYKLWTAQDVWATEGAKGA
jgi:hypothetical protein